MLTLLAMTGVLSADPTWKIHDMDRPLPPVVDSGPIGAPTGAPSDAIVLFDGTSIDAWRHGDGSTAKWHVAADGSMQVKGGTGDISTRDGFGDCQLHIEWMIPADQGHREGQHRGNSGVFFMNTYEVQVLASRDNRTYADGMAGSLYGQYPPLVNASRPMGEWNAYDIVFHRPHFDEKGRVTKPARVTVLHNGVLIQDDVELLGPTTHKVRQPYTKHADALPIRLQDHSEPVKYRNVWVRRLEGTEAQRHEGTK